VRGSLGTLSTSVGFCEPRFGPRFHGHDRSRRPTRPRR
jgi:hypothetical protein